MTYVLMRDGKPVRTTTHRQDAKYYAHVQVSGHNRRGVKIGGVRLWWTPSGKLMAGSWKGDGPQRFTGFELVSVPTIPRDGT